ncbi:EamA family transporter [Lactobacillus sp. ESL0228]|uniref:EamA family transporter n=1 Tax=Lactobacillus sp. ESL0228 TaxID=2069352 RepID=UPI0013147D70|nr:EamA family transporter [Lactobacillus sp. ESL0228]
MIFSNLWLIIFATISSLSRGIISVIDRYQMGYRKQSSIDVNFINNLCSSILVTIFLFYIREHYSSPRFTNNYLLKVVIYAFLAQIVAYGYSFVYRKVSIMQSVILSKLTDLFIPLAIFLTMGYFSKASYLVSIISTLIVVIYIIFEQRSSKLDFHVLGQTFSVIAPLLILQAAISPLLTKGLIKPIDLVFFTIMTIYLRCFISLITFWFKNKTFKISTENLSKKVYILYTIRAILTLLAQTTYTLATSSINSSIAWVFLNMTSLYSVFFGDLFLKEKMKLADILVIISILALAIISKEFL